MSEIDTRPSATRGRSSHRGGRSGFSRGGARGSRKLANGSSADSAAQAYDPIEDQGELGEMKKKYASELKALRDMFPEWTDVDLVFALHEADGDIPATVDHITQGNVSQFAEVKSSKDRARSKVKEGSGAAGGFDKGSSKAGRGRGGLESSRGGRGRGSDRTRGSIRGSRGSHSTSGVVVKDSSAVSVPTAESSAWAEGVASATAPSAQSTVVHETAAETSTTGASPWTNVAVTESTPAAASEGAKSSLIPEGGPKKSWASMFAPKPQTVPVAKTAARPPPPVEPPAVPRITTEAVSQAEDPKHPEIPPGISELDGSSLSEALTDGAASLPPSSEADEIALPPSKVPLTEENVEHLPDESHPPATVTVASTAGSADPRNLTPLPAQTPLGKVPIGGYATSAYRAAGVPIRSASFQRRVQEQQEAVVMPGHNAVDRAAVQFGSMGLGGDPGMDVDEDREEPETRQAPQHSPPSQPRTSLPPAPRHITAAPEVAEQPQVTKPAPGLPPAMQQNQQQVQEAILNADISGDASQMNQNYNQYARYGQHGIQSEAAIQQQKSYDPFSHQAQSSQYDQYGIHSQQIAQQQQQHQAHAGYGGPGSAANDASSHYSEQQRNAYHHYYGNSFGPQDMRNQVSQSQQHELGLNQQRSGSGFGAGPTDSTFASQSQQQQTQSRYGGDNANSGHTTPNPVANTQQQPMHQASSHPQGYSTGHAGFPYGHPYYNSPYQQAYNNQFGFSHQLGGYGGGYPGNKNMYAGSHGYSMAPQSSFDQHSSSPANTGAFSQTHQSTMRSTSGMSGLGGGLDDYSRTSNQSHQQSGGFGASNDPFARSTSGLGGPGGYGQQASTTQDESLKALTDNKSGPSPALGQPGRPGSASNSSGNAGQSGLPPPQGQQSSFGAYPGFPGQSQYGGLGSLGTPQHGQNNIGAQGYGSYGAGGFNQTYGAYTSRGGWGSNYGTH